MLGCFTVWVIHPKHTRREDENMDQTNGRKCGGGQDLKGEEMHALILRLLQEGMNPTANGRNEHPGERQEKRREGRQAHPLSRSMLRRLRRWRKLPATMPGMPATVSKKMTRRRNLCSLIGPKA
jgi:hypothetical protein